MDRKLASILALLLALSQVLAQEEMVVEDDYDLDELEEEFDVSDEFPLEEEKEEDVNITEKILGANRWISGLLKEGDVAFPRGRNARKCGGRDCKWEKSPSGFVEVPYTISRYYPRRQKAVIETAMNMIQSKTCIRFVPRINQKDYLNIVSKPGCWSFIGRIGGPQTVSLNLRTCVFQGLVQHELIHALGFFHEHTRSDRDKYIKINWEYVQRGAASQFQKMDSNNLNTVYDYVSIMHYDRYIFSTTYGRETMTPIPDPRVRVGMRTVMTKTDIEKINKLYQCKM